MRRVIVPVAFLSLLALMLSAVQVAAQPATPIAADDGESTAHPSGFETLVVGPLGELPMAPAYVTLARFTIAPGAATDGDPDSGPTLAHVETGSVTFAVEGPVSVIRGGTGGTPTPSDVIRSHAVNLRAGDGIGIPTGSSAELRNEGTDDATLLVLNFWRDDPPADLQAPGQAGVTIEPLAQGPVADLPAGPAAAAVVRSTYAPGQADPAPTTSGGILLAYVEAGALDYTVSEGEAAIFTSDAAATPVTADRVATLDATTTLGAGDAVIEQTETFSMAGNSGEGPAVMVIAVIGPAGLIMETTAPAAP